MSQSPFIISASPLLLPNLRARALQPRETDFSFHGTYSLEFKMDVLTKKRLRGEVRTVVHGCSGHGIAGPGAESCREIWTRSQRS